MAIPQPRRRFTVAEYERMGRAGILHEDDRVELIEGEVLQMAPIGDRHAGRTNRLNGVFGRIFGDAAVLAIQNPIELGPFSAPQPDVVLLRPRPDYYESDTPQPADVLLLVEVADTSLEYDRDVKGPLYARAGIPEYWLVELDGDRLLVYREPSPDGYRLVRTLRRGESVAPLALPDRQIPVSDILGHG